MIKTLKLKRIFSFSKSNLKIVLVVSLIATTGFTYFWQRKQSVSVSKLIMHEVKPQSFNVDVSAVGELEAARSTIIASVIPSDQSKIIYLIPDGMNVNPGDVLVRMDPTPYEQKVGELHSKIVDQEATVATLEKSLEWEKNQSEIERKVAELEIESAELELNKVLAGDGPMETSRLKSAMVKAKNAFEEMEGYYDDLKSLETEGFINFAEIKQAEKKLDEGKEAFEVATLQHDSFVNHVYPMQIKKAESQIKRALIRQEEILKSTDYKITKAESSLIQAKQQLADYYNLHKWAEYDLAMTEIKATTPGMVVLRDEYRQGQRRKPRIGDLAIKNQALLDLPDLGSLIVKSKIREVDLHKIALGKPATIEVDAYPEIAFPGKIINIGVLALPDMARFGEEKYFEVQVALEEKDLRLRPGMTARVNVHADEVHNILSVPFQAVFDIRKQSYCYVKAADGQLELRPVSIGSSNEQWISIKSGLKVGDSVCLSSPQNLHAQSK